MSQQLCLFALVTLLPHLWMIVPWLSHKISHVFSNPEMFGYQEVYREQRLRTIPVNHRCQSIIIIINHHEPSLFVLTTIITPSQPFTIAVNDDASQPSLTISISHFKPQTFKTHD